MEDLIDLLEAEHAAIVELCAQIADEQWDRPSRLPGWSVKDNLSHLIGAWNMILGRPRPDHSPPTGPHIRNDAGRWMEVDVDLRRPRRPAEVLDEYRELGAEAIAALRADPDPERTVDGPLGSRPPLGPLLGIVVFDHWIHEQDIREAVGLPARVDGPVAAHARDRTLDGFAAKLGRNPAAAGRSVAFTITDPDERTVSHRITRTVSDQGTEEIVEPHDGAADVSLRTGLDVAVRLGAGRGDLDTARAEVEITGDRELGEAVLADLAFTP